ncbi:MAG TPA: hypothetical protein ENJ80_04290 [Gammaproteobacteria bacterium]|nr:hypothetical protein [Gammaproteobacteria bacterium]
MNLVKRIETTNKALNELLSQRNAAMLEDLERNPYIGISALARKYECSKSVAARVHKAYYSSLPCVMAGKGDWGFK